MALLHPRRTTPGVRLNRILLALAALCCVGMVADCGYYTKDYQQ
jgi:hypothetical protein